VSSVPRWAGSFAWRWLGTVVPWLGRSCRCGKRNSAGDARCRAAATRHTRSMMSSLMLWLVSGRVPLGYIGATNGGGFTECRRTTDYRAARRPTFKTFPPRPDGSL